jgi:dinuclear metal center YbgI/SA1388 family protein
MPHIDELIDALDHLLTPESFEDYGPNGLQVPNSNRSHTVDTVATGVSASAELFERAAAEGAQLVLVHHGLWWRGMPQHIDRALYRRLKPLFDHDMALAAYHLPLDAHPEVGNNALLAKELGLVSVRQFATIGAAGRFPGDDGITAAELAGRVRDVTAREPLVLDFGPERIRSLAIVSGGAPDHLRDAIAEGHDAFLTGEPAERVFTQAREARIHFVAAGHYATETFGVRALGDLLADRFAIRHVFIDDPNPI